MATSSQGLSVTFGGSGLTITSVQVQDTQELLDATDLSVPANARRIFVNGFASDREVSVDYISTTILTAGQSGSLAISSPISITGNATISSASIGGSVGDFIRGSATFRVA
jgi:hypothetical protein